MLPGLSSSRLIAAEVSGGPDITSNLIGHWPLDEGSGSLANDISGSGYDGTLVGSPAWDEGGVEFGSGKRITIDSGSDSHSGDFTFFCRFRTNDLANGTMFGSRGGSDQSFDVKINYLDFQIDVGTGSGWLSNGFIGDNVFGSTESWYSVAVVATGAGITGYVDGSSTGSQSYSGTPLLFDSTHQMVIGAEKASSPGESFDGIIRDVRIFARELTADEVAALHADD